MVTKVPAQFLDLHTALASGEFDGWHFSGHGLFSNDDRNRTGIALEGNTTLSPDELVGNIKRLGNASPLVFLNACQIGRSELGLTDIGGFAVQFLKAGAAAFVGSYWSIYDEPALEFAKSFYERLIAGDTIGQAAKVSRAKINSGGDPTWLAYTVYADPLAKIGEDT
jgi:CHAT domain-containing protein